MLWLRLSEPSSPTYTSPDHAASALTAQVSGYIWPRRVSANGRVVRPLAPDLIRLNRGHLPSDGA